VTRDILNQVESSKTGRARKASAGVGV